MCLFLLVRREREKTKANVKREFIPCFFFVVVRNKRKSHLIEERRKKTIENRLNAIDFRYKSLQCDGTTKTIMRPGYDVRYTCYDCCRGLPLRHLFLPLLSISVRSSKCSDINKLMSLSNVANKKEKSAFRWRELSVCVCVQPNIKGIK